MRIEYKKHKKCFSILMMISVMACAGQLVAQEQQFQISFEGFWTTMPLPGGAHFSPLIGATHNESGLLFEPGQTASTGVENVAELGSTSALIGEINTLINAGDAGQVILRNANIGPVQTVTANFSASLDHSRLSLLTMIAPSPDWFVGVSNLDLLDANGNWRQQVVVDLNSYDAGTEEGDGFSLSNPPTNPRENVALLDDAEPGNPLFGVGSIAQVVITRTSTVSQSVEPLSVAVPFGNYVSGGVSELSNSDDVDFSARRSSTDVQSRVFVEVMGQSPSATPVGLSLTVEGSVFARTEVAQRVDFWNFETSEWELIDDGVATRFVDSTVNAVGAGDLSRFVDSGNLEVRARVRLQSLNPRQQFSANIDQISWNIDY